MIYTPKNAAGAKVFDVSTDTELRRVVSVDTDAGEVVMHHDPARLNAAGDDVATITKRFDWIVPLFDGRPTPHVFHCFIPISSQERL